VKRTFQLTKLANASFLVHG